VRSCKRPAVRPAQKQNRVHVRHEGVRGGLVLRPRRVLREAERTVPQPKRKKHQDEPGLP